jgi:hypothetical protein
LTGCTTNRIGKAYADKATAPLVREAEQIAEQERLAARELPELPGDCRKTERTGVRKDDRLDAALLKADRALGRSNLRSQRCASWYDDLKAGRE